MVDLLSKPQRDAIGIDSYERGIVWAFLGLRRAYLNSDDVSLRDIFQLSFNVTLRRDVLTQTISLRGKLFYSRNSLNLGLNILSTIEEQVIADAPNYLGLPILQSDTVIAPITDEPNLFSLEQYLYYACQQLLLSDVTDQLDEVKILPVLRGTTELPSIDIQVVIPFNYEYWLQTNNLIESIGKGIDNSTPNGIIGLLSNDSQLTNDSQLGN